MGDTGTYVAISYALRVFWSENKPQYDAFAHEFKSINDDDKDGTWADWEDYEGDDVIARATLKMSRTATSDYLINYKLLRSTMRLQFPLNLSPSLTTLFYIYFFFKYIVHTLVNFEKMCTG